MKKTQLKDLTLKELEALAEKHGEKKFRGRQLFTWMYKNGAQKYDDMQNVPLKFRKVLQETATIQPLTIDAIQGSPEKGTEKFLFRLHDGLQIESVLMYNDDRRTLCISSQVGCAVDCKFCATGAMGIKRNLTQGEIIEQVIQVQRHSDVKVTNVVAMGMGEPFLNYDALMDALEIVTSENGMGIGRKHIVVSTSGILPGIKKFITQKRPYKLAISLNATTDESRTTLMPLNKKWPIRDLMQAATEYTRTTSERITFEYVLLAGVNDTSADAWRLCTLVKGIRCKVNLIPYNTTARDFKKPTEDAVLDFYKWMKPADVPVTIRWSKGADIDAGCGQLLVTQSSSPPTG